MTKKRKLGPINRYLLFGVRSVEGWLEPYSAEFISALSDIQRRAGFAGAVGEIGVHHGKLFILLLLTAGDDERALAIDIFENQHLNTDRSGSGDRAVFLSNVQRWTGRTDQIEIIARSSFDVRPEDILSKTGPLRFVSVDGGHTEECALNDLRLVESCLSPEGIVIVDDYFNQHWPDVSTGTAKYLTDPRAKLRPFAITPNKLYLTAPQYADFYREKLATYGQFKTDKTSRMFGAEVGIYGCAHSKLTVGRCVRELVKESRIGPYALAFRALVKGTGGY